VADRVLFDPAMEVLKAAVMVWLHHGLRHSRRAASDRISRTSRQRLEGRSMIDDDQSSGPFTEIMRDICVYICIYIKKLEALQ